MMDRLEYADRNRERYLDWCYQVENSPFTALDKLEFAIISAHTLFAKSVAGFEATRYLESVEELGNALYKAGCTAPGFKAASICQLREDLETCIYPFPDMSFQEYRRSYKLPGLGHCKLSFGCCLIDPMGADVVCLDTHILQVYLGRMPTKTEVARHYNRLEVYQGVESQLLAEADDVGLPAFAYQWAVWDWKRAKVDCKPPEDHSFLWQGGSNTTQLPLFSSLA